VVLEVHTAPGHALPVESGYTVAVLTGCGLWVVTAVAGVVLPRL
jgi:hypothetical protein